MSRVNDQISTQTSVHLVETDSVIILFPTTLELLQYQSEFKFVLYLRNY
jgi:hypothetical protein